LIQRSTQRYKKTCAVYDIYNIAEDRITNKIAEKKTWLTSTGTYFLEKKKNMRKQMGVHGV
jgi:hypothetical protein